MANPSTLYSTFEQETQVWNSLKQAIADSSGFQRWKLEQTRDVQNTSLDMLVSRYLRETLETLAY
ncbi:MAG: hypothetical protein ACTS2F_13635 [Thainema sp.]